MEKDFKKNRENEKNAGIKHGFNAAKPETFGGGSLAFIRQPVNEQTQKFLQSHTDIEKELASCKSLQAILHDNIRALEAQNQQKDKIFAIVAHELRNILAPLTTSLDLAKLHKGDDPELEEVCDTIDRQMAHMTRILNDLLDVSRITMKKVELSKEWIDLGEIIRRTVEATTAHMQERKHTLTLNLYEKPIFLFLDPIRMEQVFANLFHNAAKYTDIGGKIEVTISKEGNEALVRIKDNGVGIETASLLKIFEFFVQSKKSKKCPKNGLGIGLGIAKYFTELHGGTITAYSEGPEKGSEFVVRLPIPPPGAHSMEKTLSEEKFQPLSHANV